MNAEFDLNSTFTTGVDAVNIHGQLICGVCHSRGVDILAGIDGSLIQTIYGSNFTQLSFSYRCGNLVIVSKTSIHIYGCNDVLSTPGIFPTWRFLKEILIDSKCSTSDISFSYPLISFNDCSFLTVLNVETEKAMPCVLEGEGENGDRINLSFIIAKLSICGRFLSVVESNIRKCNRPEKNFRARFHQLYIFDIGLAGTATSSPIVDTTFLMKSRSNSVIQENWIQRDHHSEFETDDSVVAPSGHHPHERPSTHALFSQSLSTVVELGGNIVRDLAWRPVHTVVDSEMLLTIDDHGIGKIWSVCLAEPSNFPGSGSFNIGEDGQFTLALQIHLLLELNISNILYSTPSPSRHGSSGVNSSGVGGSKFQHGSGGCAPLTVTWLHHGLCPSSERHSLQDKYLTGAANDAAPGSPMCLLISFCVNTTNF